MSVFSHPISRFFSVAFVLCSFLMPINASAKAKTITIPFTSTDVSIPIVNPLPTTLPQPTALPEPTAQPKPVSTPLPTAIPTPVVTPTPLPDTTTQQQGDLHTPPTSVSGTTTEVILTPQTTPIPTPLPIITRSIPAPVTVRSIRPAPTPSSSTKILASVPAPKVLGPNPLANFLNSFTPSYFYIGDSFSPSTTKNLTLTALLLGVLGGYFLVGGGFKIRRP